MFETNKEYISRKKIIDSIINQSFSLDNIPEELSEMIQLWLADDNDAQIKEEALRRAFEDDFNFADKPSKELLEALLILRQKLGISGVTPAIRVPLYKRTYFKVVSVAAMIVIISGISFSLLMNKDTGQINTLPVVSNIIVSTESREFKTIELADGSRIWLGENSTVEYPENFQDNRVVKFQGEAYFSVVKLDGKPFNVIVDALTIHVLGTEFIIRTGLDDKTTEVALSSGKVEVLNNKNNIAYELSPQEQLLLDNVTNEVIRNIVDNEYFTQYKTTGRTRMQVLTLKDVFTKIADEYNVRFNIKIEEEVCINTKIRIKINSSLPLNELLYIIQAVAEPSFNYAIDGDTVSITK